MSSPNTLLRQFAQLKPTYRVLTEGGTATRSRSKEPSRRDLHRFNVKQSKLHKTQNG